MQLVRQHLFAHPGLALQQHRNVRGRHLLDPAFDAVRPAAAHHVVALRRPLRRALKQRRPRRADGLGDALRQILVAHRLGQKIRRPVAHRFHDVPRRGGPRDHDHRRARAVLPQLPQRFDAVLARHHDVHQHQRDAVFVGRQMAQHFLAGLGEIHLIALALQRDPQIVAHFRLVFGNQNSVSVVHDDAPAPRRWRPRPRAPPRRGGSRRRCSAG